MKFLAIGLVVLCAAAMAVAAAEPDLIFVNARIRTMDTKKPTAEAVAVSGGLISAVGTNAEIRRLASDRTQVVDAGGKLLIPGFNDAHVHFAGVGNWFSHLDATNIKDSKGLLDRIARFARFLPKGRWILGAKLASSSIPSQKELDAVSSEHPVLIYLKDPAFALVNSATLDAASLRIGDDPVVSGVSLQRVRNSIPKNNSTNWAEITEAASNYAASLGVTSVQDVHSDNLLATYRRIAASGKLKTRIYECVGLGDWEKDRSIGLKVATGDAMVRGGCVKWFADGSVEERAELGKRIAEADKAGLQVMVHAIGSRANKNTIDAFQYATSKNGKRDRRFRVEHAHKIANPDISRLSRLSIIASMQPALFYRDGDAGDNFSFIFRSGTKVAFGSDASMIDIDPMQGIHSAVNSRSGSVSVETAVAVYTIGSAYAEFQEDVKGSISVGKLADLVLLSDDIFTMRSTDINRTKVEMTIMNGRVVYDAKCELQRRSECKN